MLSRKILTSLLGLSLFVCFSANANIISFGNTIVNSPQNFEGFDRTGPTSIVATNEFSANGLTINTISGVNGPTANINSQCNVGGLSGTAWLMIGVRPTCGVDGDLNIVDLVFDTTVTELSFLFRTNNEADYLFETFLSQTQQSALDVSRSVVGSTSQILFTGQFDRIRFTEQTNSTWFWVDDMRWNTTAVSAPTTLGLLLVSLFVVAFRRYSN